MPLNHYVTLGRSGLRVSPFCLGTMTFAFPIPFLGLASAVYSGATMSPRLTVVT